MGRGLISRFREFLRFTPGEKPAFDEPSVLRSARHNAPIAWARIPLVLVISIWLYVFVSIWAWAIWLAVTLLVEQVAAICRNRLLKGDLHWGKAHIASLFALSLCWIAMSAMVWNAGGDVARIAAIMGTLSLAVYGAIGGYKDGAVLAALVGPPVIALPMLMAVDLWTNHDPGIALLGTISTIGTSVTVAVLALALNRSDTANLKAMRDLTATAEALKESQSILERSTAVAGVGWWHYTFATNTVVWSDNVRRIFGVGPDYVPTPQFASEFYAPEWAAVVQSNIAKAVRTGTGWNVVAPLRTRDGRDAWIRGIASVITEDGIPVKIIGAMQDITNEKRLQDDLVEAQKFELVGRFAGALAHDLNNAMTAALNATEILARSENAQARVAAQDTIRNAARRASDLANNLLSYSQRQVLSPRVSNVNEILRDFARLLGKLFAGDITVHTHLDHETPHTLIDPAQLANALYNLAINAREAMPNGGVLTLASRIAQAKTEAGLVQPYVHIDVIDTGPGVPVEIREKIFEPLFSTRSGSPAAGLALSIAHGFAAQSGGFLVLQDSKGGAHFTFGFPLAQPSDAVESAVIPVAAARKVLLVENDTLVADALCYVLADAGFEVRCVHSGEAAIDEMLKDPHVDVLLTDVVLEGGLSGPEAAAQVLQHCPSARVVFMSGYAHDKLSAHDLGDASFLRKPFVLGDFLKLIDVAPQGDATISA